MPSSGREDSPHFRRRVGAAIEVAKQDASVDILFGIGGTPEGASEAASAIQIELLTTWTGLLCWIADMPRKYSPVL